MLEKIKDKYLLFDTNLIIEASKHKDAFSQFSDKLKQNNITPGYDQVIKLEFLRSSRNLKDLSKKKRYLRLLFGKEENEFILPVKQTVTESAKDISLLINHQAWKNAGKSNKKKIETSAEDCLIAAQLKDYRTSTYLATLNYKHFPVCLFERIGLEIVEDREEVFVIGIVGFSVEKWNNAVDEFNKSG